MRTAIFSLAAGLGLFLLPSAPLQAALITVGTHDLLPNTPGQVVQIPITGGDLLTGMDMYIQIDGPALAPVFQNVNIVVGTIFDSNNVGQTDLDVFPDFWFATTVTQTGTVAASGILVIATIDTTGVFSGQWDLKMADTELMGIGPLTTQLMNDAGLPFFPDIVNGLLRISAQPAEIPEPSAMAIWGVLGLAGLGVRRFRRARG